MNKYQWKKFPIEYNKLCICIVCNNQDCKKCSDTLSYIQNLCSHDVTHIKTFNISWDDNLKNYKKIEDSGQYIVCGNDKDTNTYLTLSSICIFHGVDVTNNYLKRYNVNISYTVDTDITIIVDKTDNKLTIKTI
jgi:hypothetical protein